MYGSTPPPGLKVIFGHASPEQRSWEIGSDFLYKENMIQKQRQSIDWLINRETQREPIVFDLRGAKFVSALRRVSIVSFASATYRKTAPENSSKVENTVKTYGFG